MHPSLARLLRLARDGTATSAHPIQTLLQLRKHLGVTAQTMNNWKQRGISKEGAIQAASAFTCHISAILDDNSTYWAEPQPQTSGAHPRGLSVNEIGLKPYMLAPTIVWEQILRANDLPLEFQVVLVDDAMAPKAPAGTKAKFRRDLKPAPGDAVLVADKAGELYCRVYHGGLHGAWEARATNAVYPALESKVHGLRVVAVFTGIEVSWSQLSR